MGALFWMFFGAFCLERDLGSFGSFDLRAFGWELCFGRFLLGALMRELLGALIWELLGALFWEFVGTWSFFDLEALGSFSL